VDEPAGSLPRPAVKTGTLIVGASQAGLQLAVSLRELGDTAPITLVGEELHPPYQRPPLSKEFLAGSAELGTLAFRKPDWYAAAGIELVTGERVTDLALSPGGHPGGAAVTATGREIAFDRLALTTGAGARRLSVPGAELDGISYLRDIDDAARLRTRLSEATNVVVVGGGFIGLEAAAAARAQGKPVTVVEAAERLVARNVAPVVSEFCRQAHERRGATVLLSATVAAFRGDHHGRVCAVVLGDGRELPADLVVVGVGVVPRTELAQRIGLECDGAIVVDAHARTSHPSVVAAGDCTVRPHPLTGEGRVRLESVQNAVAQATVAAATLLGRFDDPRSVPWFWSNQADVRLQMAGLSTGYDEHVVRGEPDSERFSVLYYREGRLLAVDAVNNPVDYMVVRKALTQGATIPADKAADAATPLKSLLSSAGVAA
jgi:3-phenylpropionate/trans-cinnamate dioxygenase ferredoxin reductase subunit